MTSIIHFMRIVMTSIVGTGDTILFWHDVWYGICLLAMQFPNFYGKAKFTNTITVAQVWNQGRITISLFRGASLLLRREKDIVMAILNSLSLDDTQ